MQVQVAEDVRTYRTLVQIRCGTLIFTIPFSDTNDRLDSLIDTLESTLIDVINKRDSLNSLYSIPVIREFFGSSITPITRV